MIRKTPSKQQQEADQRKQIRKKIGLSLAALLFLIGIAWAWQSYAKLRAFSSLKDQAVAVMDQPNSWEDLQELRDLAPLGYAQKFSDFIRDQYSQREEQRMRDFFAMSKEEQNSALDREIADEMRRAKEREKSRAERDAARAAGGGASSQRPGSGGGNSNQGGGNNAAGGQNPGGSGGGGSGFRDRTLSRRLDRGSPEGRAMRAAYSTLANERRAAAGLPPRRSPRARM